VKSNIKTMLIAFFDIDGLAHHEKWLSGNWILHHDNAPAHRAVTTKEFLVKHIPSLPQPPYSLTLLRVTSSCSHN
jgi:hypothetical protein